MKKRSKHGQAVTGATPAGEPTQTENATPRTISFQPTDAVRDALEKARVKLGLRSRSTLINEALALYLRPMFGKTALEEEAVTIARAESRFGGGRKAA
jgi:hypothetical protein